MLSPIPHPSPVLRAALVAIAFSLLVSSVVPAATITFIGVELGTAGSGYATQNWSNAGVAKEYDLSGNVYGTAGYYQIRPIAYPPGSTIYSAAGAGNDLGITAGSNPTLYSAPAILSSITGGAGDYVNFNSYSIFRGPNGSDLYTQGGLSVGVNQGPYSTPSGSNNGYFGNAFSFTMGMSATFRVGVAVDMVASGTYAPNYVSLYNSGTGTVFSQSLTRDGSPDMTVFEIDAAAGDSFTAALWQLSGTQSAAAFGLITFDVSRYNFDVGSGLSQTNSVSLNGAPAGVLKTGAGTLVMASSNSAAGGALVSGGTMVMAAGAVIGGNITNNSTLVFDGAHGGVANAVSGTGSLVKSGAGIATFYASNSYTGATVVSGGQLMLGGAGALSTNTTLQIDSGASVNLTGSFAPTNINRTIGGLTGAGILYGVAGTVTVNKTSGSDTFSGDIQSGQGLIKAGSGTLVLSGSNSYTGGTLISGGTLALHGGSIKGGITNNGNLSIAADLTNVVSGAGSLTKTGVGIAALWNPNTYTGATVINEGQLMLAGSGALSTNTAVQIAAGASLRLDGYFAPNNINRTIGGLAGAGVLYSAGGTVTVDKASGSDTFSGDIQGGQGLIKAGSGTFVLSGANSYTGGTTISAGTLQIGDGGATGSISGAITNNAALVYNRSNNLSQGGVISGTGTLAKSGNGTLTLDSANTYSGGTVINAGTLRIGNGGTTGSVAGPITNNAALVYNRSDNLTQGGVISGTGALVKSGNGTLTLDSANTYSGATVVSAGTLRLDGSGALSTSTALQVDSGATFSTTGSIATSNNATVAGLTGTGTVSGLAGTLTVSKNTNASDVFSGSINGGIGLTLAGSTQLWLAGSNNYTGATLLSGSDTVLNLVHGSGLGSTAAGTTVSSGSVLRIQGTNNGGSGITVGAEALTIIGQGRAGNGGALRSVSGTNTWQGKVTLSGDARIGAASGSILTLDVASGNAVESANFNFATEGAGHVQVNDAISLGTGSLTKLGTGSLILGAANSYSGGTTLSEGFLRLDHAGAAGSGSITQTTNNSTLQINATGTVANAMSIFNVRTMQTVTLSGHKTLNNATYTVDAGTTTTESGNLTGAGGITKQGTGTLLVTGNNSYTGAVSVNAGVLNLNSSVGGAAATTSSVSVANGATLLLSQSDQVSNTAAVTLSGGTIQRASGVSEVFGSLNLTTSSFLDFSGGTAGTIEFSGISYTPSALLALNIANFTQGNTLVFQTTNSLSMTGFNFSGSGGFGSSSFNGSTFTITAIPEPSTWLAAAGLLGLLLWPLRNRFADAVRRS